MKSAQLETEGKTIKEAILIINPAEAKHLALAMNDYREKHPRSKKIAALCDELETNSLFF